MATIPLPSRPQELTRFARFLAVGALGTALDFGALAALKSLGLPTLPANTLSFSIGVANNFTWNRSWTFADRAGQDWRRQLLHFTLVSLAGLAMNNALLFALEAPLGALLGAPSLGYLPAKAIATAVVVFWNYFANRAWTFNTVRTRR